MPAIVEIRSLSKIYDSGRYVLDQVDLDIRDGEILVRSCWVTSGEKQDAWNKQGLVRGGFVTPGIHALRASRAVQN
jgi:hypothetical protein